MTALQGKQRSLKSQCEASRSVLTGNQTRLPKVFKEGFKSLPFSRTNSDANTFL